MDKQSKDKKNTPKPQGWDKTDRNFKRTGNEADVHGELAIRGKGAKEHRQKEQDQDQSNNKDKKQSR